jgi:hypothetical protein
MMRFLFSICAAFALAGTATGATIVIAPFKDNTLFEGTDPLSNGAGPEIFAGRTGDNALTRLRRALLQFDIAAAVPAGATINNVTLTLRLVRVSVTIDSTMKLYEVLADWGEGGSISNGGAGADATIGDATWTHAFYDTQEWRTAANAPRPGGYFSNTVSASGVVGTTMGPYSWSGAELISDVQGWLDAPGSNHGWILLGGEAGSRTARGFASREYSDPAYRPALTIEYTIPEAGSAALLVTAGFSLLLHRKAFRKGKISNDRLR